MSYRIAYTQQASREMQAAADWWAENRDRDQAARWYVGFSEKILSLADDPQRMPLTDENDDFPYEIRELHFGLSSRPTHHAVFTIVGQEIVLGLTIRHAAQDRITPDMIDPTV
jgi:plasmid stabilization system protein ParE